MEEAAKQTATTNGGHAAKTSRKDLKSRALTELAPNGNLSCLLTTADPDMATRTHFLYETGGNIGKGRVWSNTLATKAASKTARESSASSRYEYRGKTNFPYGPRRSESNVINAVRRNDVVRQTV